jgi:signal transduction histidine kinase
MADVELPDTVWASLGLAAIELDDDDIIRHPATSPDWLRGMLPGDVSLLEAAITEGSSPFLCSFLLDNHDDWPEQGERPRDTGSWEEVLGPEGSEGFEARLLRVDGRRIIVIERLGTRYDELVRILRTARRNALEHQRLQKDVELRDVLVHCIVHDLNSPATAIQGALGMVELDELPEHTRPLVAIAQRGAANQTRLIGDILDVLKAGSEETFGVGESNSGTADLAACGDTVVADLQGIASRHDCHLEWSDPADESVSWRNAATVVTGEVSRVKRIFTNLVENALRISPSGATVRVGCDREDQFVVGWVDDQGPGVDPELGNSIFDRFRTSKDARRRGKSGLGLFFCRITVERWGGQIGYTPREGGGTRFWFRLPRP